MAVRTLNKPSWNNQLPFLLHDALAALSAPMDIRIKRFGVLHDGFLVTAATRAQNRFRVTRYLVPPDRESTEEHASDEKNAEDADSHNVMFTFGHVTAVQC